MSGKEGRPGYLKPGTTVGPYLVEEQIGGGGFGFVYRVLRDGQAYALKIAHSRLSALPPEERAAAVDRLDREIASLKSLHHPNIVRIHSFERWPDLEGGYPYLVMDLVDGSSLQEWRAAGTPSLARIVAVFEKVADALVHMHKLGIIHRDLKSQNILVTGEGEPFIVDFGIARPSIAYDITRAAGVGTLTHLTPEYVAFLDSAEARSGVPFGWRPTTDLYTLGYVLYEALARQPPVPHFTTGSAKEEFELLAAIKGEAPRRPRDLDPRVPVPLDDLVMELLEKDPARRPQEAAQVVERLRKAREAGEAGGDPIWTFPFDAEAPAAAVRSAPEDAGDVIQPLETGAGTHGPQAAVAGREGAQAAPPARAAVRSIDSRVVPKISLPMAGQAQPFEDVETPHADHPKAPDGWGDQSQILKRMAAQWAAAEPKPRPRRLLVLVTAGAGVVALLLLFIAARDPVDQQQPRTLLSAVEAGGLAAVPSQKVLPAEPPPAPQADRGLEPAQASTKAPAEELGQSRLSQFPDRQLVVKRAQQNEEPSGLVRSRPFGPEPGVLQTSQRAASAGAASSKTSKGHGVAFGAHLQARLLTNLDTRTIANGPVEALLHVPYVVRGQVVLPTRTMVYGTASESGSRFTVRFHRMRLPDDTEVAFEGVALARDDGKPGLAASGRVGQEPKRAAGLGNEIAKGTGNLLLDTITGGTPQSIVRGAGQSALNHEEPQPTGGDQWALLLDAGVIFDIFVEKAF